MKKYFITVFLVILLILSYLKFVPIIRDKLSVYKGDVDYVVMLHNKFFFINRYGKWQKEFIKGVNIGVGKPGAFPGELAITKDDYLRWFKYISDMNANTIRVYTILKPDFYDALLEYNRKSIRPLYVLLGVWVNEEDIANYSDVYNSKITERFKSDIKNTIDIIHGNCTLPFEAGHASGEYKSDISPYVIGWILGIEWNPHLVMTTNKNNSEKNNCNGKILNR